MNYTLVKAQSTNPLLTICCITYNHADFIPKAINSFLAQQTNFSIEIIIHDDASSDGTSDIIRYYQEKHPNLFTTILQSENQYSSRGFGFFSDMLEQAQGKYIALCEGDDYWTDPNKLQKQVDFLEENPDFSICFHKVQILEDGELKDDYITKSPANPVSTIDDLAWGNYIHTCSCVFKNLGAGILGPSFTQSPLGDYYLHMMNAQHGKIYELNSIMAVYRAHSASLWSSLNRYEKFSRTIKAAKCILEDLVNVHQSTKDNLIDACINNALEARNNIIECDDMQFLAMRDLPDYISRIEARLSDSLDKNLMLEQSLSAALEQNDMLERQLQLTLVGVMRNFILRTCLKLPSFSKIRHL